MNWEIGKCLALSACLGSSLSGAEPAPKITVFVYNYAAVRPEVLILTEAEASRICRQADIEIDWLGCPLAPKEAAPFPACQVPPGPTRLALRILSQAMAERLRQPEDSFGFAMIPEDGSFATMANVFWYDAEQLANRRGMRHGVLLGHLAAHELGHLLLGMGSHASRGIMHVPWRPKELDAVTQGLMLFRPEEAEEMRANIRARAARENRRQWPVLLELSSTKLTHYPNCLVSAIFPLLSRCRRARHRTRSPGGPHHHLALGAAVRTGTQ